MGESTEEPSMGRGGGCKYFLELHIDSCVVSSVKANSSNSGVRALVLVPTKELAKQAHRNIKVNYVIGPS